MQMQPVPQPSSKPALRSGIILGIALGVIHSVIIVFTQLSTPYGQYGTLPTATIVLYLIIPLIWIAGLLMAGFIGGKASGKVGTATIAGLFAGTFGGILASVGQIVSTALSMNMQAQNGGYVSTNPGFLLVTGFGIIIYTLILTIGGGAGFGALGGLLGQSFSNVRPQPPVVPVAMVPHPVAPFPMPQPYPQPYPPVTPVYGYMPPQPQAQPQPHPEQPPSENIG